MMEFRDFKGASEPGSKTQEEVYEVFATTKEDELPISMVDMATGYGEEKKAIRDAENIIKKRKADLATTEEKLYALLEDQGITSFSTGGFTYFARVDTYASVDPEIRDVAFAWIKRNGYDYLIKEAVNAQSLTTAVKEYIEENLETPGETDGIKIRAVNRVGIRKKQTGDIMEDVKKDFHLHYEEKDGNNGKIMILKDQNGRVKFMKIGFGTWEKVEGE